MRKSSLFLTLFFICGIISGAASQEHDTLYTYNTDRETVPYQSVQALWYMSRIDLEEPIHLHSVRVKLEGSGSFTFRLFGQEGGSPYAEMEADLIDPIQVEKNGVEAEFVDIPLPEPIYLDDNQIFCLFELADGMSLYRDRASSSPSCESGSGGQYYPTVLAVPGNHQFYDHLWTVIAFPLAVELVHEKDHADSYVPHHFVDITESKGLPTDMSSRSIGWADYNGDGALDLLVAGRLFQQNAEDKSFVEMTEDAGINGAARANCFADLNGDGLQDILLFHTQNYAYLNNGDGTFQEVVLTELPEVPAISSFSLADVDGDDDLDLFIGQLWTTYPVPGTNYLFLNKGDGRFTDGTTRIYPRYDGQTNFPSATACDPDNSNTWLSGRNRGRRSRGSEFVDYDNDGDLDLYVVNYFLEYDEFYENDGSGNFTNVINKYQLGYNQNSGNHGTGLDWEDFDNDGDMDLLLCQFAHPWGIKLYDHRGTTIYLNEDGDNISFTDTRGDNGIDYEETHAGASWGDADNDGLLDFAITTYYGCREVDIYKQADNHQMENNTYEYGLDGIVSGEDVNWVDYDKDGRLDLCMGKGNRFRLLKNDGDSYSRHFIGFHLEKPSGNTAGAGARVYVESGGKTYMRELSLGRGQRMQSPLIAHFGLGWEQEIDEVNVKWPDGSEQSYGTLEVDHYYRLTKKGEAFVSIDKKGEGSNFDLYPNPTSGHFKVVKNGAFTLELISLNGRILAEWKGNNNAEISVDRDLNSGIYLLQLRCSEGIYRKPLIIR